MAGSALLGFAVIPMGSLFGINLQLADPETGLAYVFAVASIATLGLAMGGYASNNKYSLLGGLRAVAQNIAYEIPLVVTAASVVLFTGTLQMSQIVAQQQETLISIGGIAIPSWYAFVNPFAFVLFLAANLAEVGRNPFDTPEAPTEIVAGYQTEYSSVYFVLFYLGEFIHIFLGGAIIATLFLGGPSGPASGVHRIRLVHGEDLGGVPVHASGRVRRSRVFASTNSSKSVGRACWCSRSPTWFSRPSSWGWCYDRTTQIDGNDDEARTGRLRRSRSNTRTSRPK